MFLLSCWKVWRFVGFGLNLKLTNGKPKHWSDGVYRHIAYCSQPVGQAKTLEVKQLEENVTNLEWFLFLSWCCFYC